MSEHTVTPAEESTEPESCAWPVWEVQGHGTVTAVEPPEDSGRPEDAGRREVRPPWVDVRLTFADGARIDVLAVVHGGRIAIEDARADPPLALDGLAALAGMIGEPLRNACEVVTGRAGSVLLDGLPAPGPAGPAPVVPVVVEAPDLRRTEPERGAGEPEPETSGASYGPERTALHRAETERAAPGQAAPEEAEPPPADPLPDRAEEAVQPSVPQSVQPSAQSSPQPSGTGPDRAREPSGRHRAHPAPRCGVADVYRTAQRDGRDPVLAVMAATGFSRRKSLRLIATARDEGHLTPRHHRR